MRQRHLPGPLECHPAHQAQLSARIGGVDEDLIRQVQQAPNYASLHRRRAARRLISLAAALALMAVSFTAGAVAFG